MIDNKELLTALSNDIEKLTHKVDNITDIIVDRKTIITMIEEKLEDVVGVKLEPYSTTNEVSQMIIDHIAPLNRSLAESRQDFKRFVDKFDAFVERLEREKRDSDSQLTHNRRDIDIAMNATRQLETTLNEYRPVWEQNADTIDMIDKAIRGDGESNGLVGKVNMIDRTLPELAAATDNLSQVAHENTAQIGQLLTWRVETQRREEKERQQREEMKKYIKDGGVYLLTRLSVVLGGGAVGATAIKLFEILAGTI